MLALIDYLAARLSRNAGEALHRQLYRLLRDAVQTGLLAHREALPASRELAGALGVGRNTVLHAYEQLVAEGFLASRGGAGTFVAYIAEAVPMAAPTPGPDAAVVGFSRRGEVVLKGVGPGDRPRGAGFTPGRPDLDAFPWATWQRLLARRQRAMAPAEAAYRSEGGHAALKQALAAYLPLSRGVRCTAQQILITGGMQQSLDLIARALADAGDVAWVEEPGYVGAKIAWQANGLRLAPVPIDAEGLDWRTQPHPAPRLIYTSPSHQYPLGCVMSLPRRLALLAEAARHGAWVVEDDYDSEFRHRGQPLAAMQGLDGHGRVVYLGTFSKVMFPALRMGYLVAPEPVVAALARLQARLYREGDYTTQATVADFMAEGHFSAHMRRMRQLYARRQAKLRAVLAQALGVSLDGVDGGFALLGGAAGMHVTLRLPADCDDGAVSAALAGIGLDAPALSGYCLGKSPFPGLVLGYGGLDDAALTLATVRLARVLREMGWVRRYGCVVHFIDATPPLSLWEKERQ